MSITFIRPTDPRIFGPDKEDWVRNHLYIISIEELEGSGSAFFVMGFRDPHSEDSRNFRMVVKVKNFFREHFYNYNAAIELINKIKDPNYGK